jgi:peptidoglycan/xylan/chitin deacetylase (PgdA/CDA1 family)
MLSYTHLLYHELVVPGRVPCRDEPGYLRYVLAATHFEIQMRWLKDKGWRVMSVSEALEADASPGLAITFDDGCETDLLVAAPLLQELGFQATFYITYAFLGTPGFMSIEQLRQLSRLGFEIGCHSMTHAYLSDADDVQLNHEIVEPKVYLEQILARPVEHFSCPGGRYSDRVAEIAHLAGYRTVATSRPHANGASTNALALGRVAVMRGMELPQFVALCRREGLWQMDLRDRARRGAMRLLGNSLYDRVRETMLRADPPR